MAITSGFFMSVNGDRKYKAEFFAQYFASFIGNGVFPNPSSNMQIVENNGMTVNISIGKAWIDGYIAFNDDDYVLNIEVADGVLNRIDRVVLRLDTKLDREIKVLVKKGTFASSPVAPTLQRDADAYEIALADIYVGKGVISITQANITDLRLNSELCGIVHGVVDQVDTTTLFAQYASWYEQTTGQANLDIDAMLNQFMSDFNAWYTTNTNQWSNEFTVWFDSIKGQLEGDIAANLASQVTDLQNTKADKTALTLVENNLGTHLADNASEHYRLASLTNNMQREVAYLNLQQEVSSRIENGTTFADDIKGNAFGITFNETESSNVSFDNEGMYMAESSFTENVVEDATVVNQAYDTSGNGGRKLVRLDNGWLVASVYDSVNRYLRIYKTEKGDWTDSVQLCYTEVGAPLGDYALSSSGSNVYLLLSNGTLQVYFMSFNALTQTNVRLSPNVISGESGMGNVSLAINEAQTELHATWSSKNSTYSSSFNIRYAKGTINADGSVTWGSVEQVTKLNNASYGYSSPSILIIDNTPCIVADSNGIGHVHGKEAHPDYKAIDIFKRDSSLQTGSGYIDSKWSNGTIYDSTYTQSSPSAIFVPPEINGLPNGRIWVAWHGKDSVNTGYDCIKVSYSDDGGVTWSEEDSLSKGDSYYFTVPSITANSSNEIFILAQSLRGANTYSEISRFINSSNVWSEPFVIASEVDIKKHDPSSLYDNTFSIDFSGPLFVYRSQENAKVGFYGTWTVGSETPTLTGTSVYDLPSTDYVGAFVQKEGSINIDAYINDVKMDESLENDEYMFTQSLDIEAPVKLRLELSRVDTLNGNNDKVTRILGGVS